MILNNTPQNEAVLSNVGEIGEFRIRNSAKAFNILSSGLYANKIRAVIRELSCNAVDSHVAAGRSDVPFDVHLPTDLEPWVAIRDYGTGLDHEQVTNIYTTYFESTKSDSNAFIGALGLGSKSPFSYTDNFTVTAVKNGRKGIYTAFINEQGVPSIALMMEEQTDEPSGVEVKFGVEDRWDFRKFADEAQTVFQHFKLKPVVTGPNHFQIPETEYLDRDIVPGVHSMANRQHDSVAVMGNIAYPIAVPNQAANLGNLAALLKCGLEMHFDIGELDFQASREGLSYIPQTIDSIKRKLEAVNAQLTIRLAGDADKIDNLWDRAMFLQTKAQQSLWNAAVQQYVADTEFELMELSGSYIRVKPFLLSVEDLRKTYNISIKGFTKSTGNNSAANMKSQSYRTDDVDANGFRISVDKWRIDIDSSTYFVVNTGRQGAAARAKYHWREVMHSGAKYRSDSVYILEAADKTLPMKVAEFFALIKNPPTDRRIMADTMAKQERARGELGKDATILKLVRKDDGDRWYRGRDGDKMVWRDAGALSTFDDTVTHYYMPLLGFQAQSNFGVEDLKWLSHYMLQSGLFNDIGTIYGVRKSDIDEVNDLDNWVNVEEYIVEKLNAVTTADFELMAIKSVDIGISYCYSADVLDAVDDASPFKVLINKVNAASSKNKYVRAAIQQLMAKYTPSISLDMANVTAALENEAQAVRQRYPLLTCLGYDAKEQSAAIAQYINLVDAAATN